MLQTFLYQNTTISYRDIGTGQPVVLLHGFGEDSHIFDHQIDFLKNHCRLIVPDLPGSGKSPDNITLMGSIDEMADGIMFLIESITKDLVILLGHSMGGYITMAIAEKYPHRLKAFGLLHSSALPDNEDKKTARRKSIAFIQQNGAFAFLQTAIPGLFAEGYQKEQAAAVAALVAKGQGFTKEALIAYYEAMIKRPDRTEILRGSKMPVLFVLGTLDKAVPLTDGLKQVHLPNVSYFYVLEKAGHMGMWEATAAINSLILKFIISIG